MMKYQELKTLRELKEKVDQIESLALHLENFRKENESKFATMGVILRTIKTEVALIKEKLNAIPK